MYELYKSLPTFKKWENRMTKKVKKDEKENEDINFSGRIAITTCVISGIACFACGLLVGIALLGDAAEEVLEDNI